VGEAKYSTSEQEGSANEDHFANNQKIDSLLSTTSYAFFGCFSFHFLKIICCIHDCHSSCLASSSVLTGQLLSVAVNRQWHHTFRGVVNLRPLLFGTLRYVAHIILLLSLNTSA